MELFIFGVEEDGLSNPAGKQLQSLVLVMLFVGCVNMLVNFEKVHRRQPRLKALPCQSVLLVLLSHEGVRELLALVVKEVSVAILKFESQRVLLDDQVVVSHHFFCLQKSGEQGQPRHLHHQRDKGHCQEDCNCAHNKHLLLLYHVFAYILHCCGESVQQSDPVQIPLLILLLVASLRRSTLRGPYHWRGPLVH